MRAVIKRRGAAAAKVSEDDVLRAIEKLRVLGGGWSALNVGGRVVVRSGSFVRSFIHSFILSSRRSHTVLYDVPVRAVRAVPRGRTFPFPRELLRFSPRPRRLTAPTDANHRAPKRSSSVPTELNADQGEVIRVAGGACSGGAHHSGGAHSGGSHSGRADAGTSTRGAVTRTSLMRVTGWEGARADAALRELIRCGACMVDDGDAIAGERVYWLPCVSEGAA